MFALNIFLQFQCGVFAEHRSYLICCSVERYSIFAVHKIIAVPMDGDLDNRICSCQCYSMLRAGCYLLTGHGDRHTVRCRGHQRRRFCIIRNVNIQAACSEVGIRAYSAARGQIAQLNLTFDVERIILRQRRIICF